MQDGQFILDRWCEEMLVSICRENNISLQSYSDNWVYTISKNGKTGRIFGYKFSLNDSVSSLIASDKVATYQVLNSCNLPAVEHRLIRTKASKDDSWADGFTSIVIKPLDGTSGHGVKLFHDDDAAQAYMDSKPGILAWTVSPFETIETERRLIILDGNVLCQYEKSGVMVEGLTMHNLGLGAQATNVASIDSGNTLAKEAMEATGLRLASVDIVKIANTWKILEINDGIMMENYMRQSRDNKEIGLQVYRKIIGAMVG